LPCLFTGWIEYIVSTHRKSRRFPLSGRLFLYGEPFKKHWYAIFNELKERWPALTQSDLDYICGERKRLTAVVKKRRHIAAEEASRDVDEFVETLDIHQRLTAIKS
jgi:hypothetical protein